VHNERCTPGSVRGARKPLGVSRERRRAPTLRVAYNGWLLGYFKASEFTMLNHGGCKAAWYLEVLDQKPGTAWVQTHMGTGKFGHLAAAGEAAWVRKPMYWDTNYVLLAATTDFHMEPEISECYTRSKLMDLGPELGRLFLAGGPGGINPLCTK